MSGIYAMKKSVLVFPCGSEIGLEVYRSLRYSIHFNVIGGSSVDDHGMFVYKNYIGNIPDVGDETFVEKINEIVTKNQIDFIIPTHDSVVLKLAQAGGASQLKCAVMTSPLETCETTRSKLKTYEHFKGIIPTPKVFNHLVEVQPSDLPLFLKPEVGQGTRGTYLASTVEDVEFYAKKDPSLLLLEYLPGREYTVDCFTNKDGALLFCEGRERRRVLNGISVNTTVVRDEHFNQLAKTINEKLTFRGVWFFQLKENKDGRLTLLEIAPRVAGTMGLARSRGVNLVLLSLFDAMDQDVSVFENSYNIVMDRALENLYRHNINCKHVYLDFDDLVVFEGRINPAVMAFVFQCINNGVAVHLITRHKEVLDETLQKYRLAGVFDELIWIQNNDKKSAYIKEKDAILIDDSFAERKEVHEICDIPVFDSHMIESLMEKF